MAGNSFEAQLLQIEKVLNTLIEKQMKIYDRVERLETLEFHKKSWGIGCITFSDYDRTGPVFRVDTDPIWCGPDLDEYCFTHMTIWWRLSLGENIGPLTAWMQFDGVGAANYAYSYTYTQGGVTVQGSVNGATALYIGNVAKYKSAYGIIHIPFWPRSGERRAWGEWVMYDYYAESGNQIQRGNWGGYLLGSSAKSIRYDLFLTGTPTTTGHVYLYGWCPRMTLSEGPPD